MYRDETFSSTLVRGGVLFSCLGRLKPVQLPALASGGVFPVLRPFSNPPEEEDLYGTSPRPSGLILGQDFSIPPLKAWFSEKISLSILLVSEIFSTQLSQRPAQTQETDSMHILPMALLSKSPPQHYMF